VPEGEVREGSQAQLGGLLGRGKGLDEMQPAVPLLAQPNLAGRVAEDLKRQRIVPRQHRTQAVGQTHRCW
jgi:hypothetical protein